MFLFSRYVATFVFLSIFVKLFFLCILTYVFLQLPTLHMQVSLAGGQPQAGNNQLEQALHDLMNNKATIQALAGQRMNAGLPGAPQIAGLPGMSQPGQAPPGLIPTSHHQVSSYL